MLILFNSIIYLCPAQNQEKKNSKKINKKPKKHDFSVVFPYGLANKKAVVVVLNNAFIKKFAVFGPLWSFDLTSNTKII